MTRDKQTTLEIEIRDTNPHESNNVDTETGVTVVEDTHHNTTETATDSRFRLYDEFSIYIEDNHDQAFDVDVQSTAHDDTDYSGAVSEGIVSLGSGVDAGRVRINGNLGRIKLSTTAPSSLPTEGSMRVVVQALGRMRR